MAVVSCPQRIEPQEFGVLVARNRAEQTDPFMEEEVDISWLADGSDQKGQPGGIRKLKIGRSFARFAQPCF